MNVPLSVVMKTLPTMSCEVGKKAVGKSDASLDDVLTTLIVACEVMMTVETMMRAAVIVTKWGVWKES